MEKLFFTTTRSGSSRSVDTALSGRRECRHDDTSCPILDRTSRAPLHLVPGPDEEAPRRRQAVRSLHVPQVRLPAHDQARSQACHPRSLTVRLFKMATGGASDRQPDAITSPRYASEDLPSGAGSRPNRCGQSWMQSENESFSPRRRIETPHRRQNGAAGW
ncbi:MAG: hypothetical protein RL042_1921 [Nitrospirota bacterium]